MIGLPVRTCSSPSWSMRARAVKVLGRMGGADAERTVIAALGDSYAFVRSAAARALGSIAGPESTAALARTLARDQEGLVRATAVEALGKIGGPEAREALERGLRSLGKYFGKYGLELDADDLVDDIVDSADRFGVLR